MGTRVPITVEGNFADAPVFGESARGTMLAKFRAVVIDRHLHVGAWVDGDKEFHRAIALGRTEEDVRDAVDTDDRVIVAGGLKLRYWTDAVSGDHRRAAGIIAGRGRAIASLRAGSRLVCAAGHLPPDGSADDELVATRAGHRAVTVMSASRASVALLVVCCFLKQFHEKALPLICHVLKPRLVASRNQQPFARCGLAPCVEKLERDLLGGRRRTQWVGAQDPAAQLVAGIRHDEVEHRIELRQVDGHGRRFHARGAADSGRGERSRRNSRVAQQHLRSIRFNLVYLAHVDRMTDEGCLCAATAFGIGNSPFARAVRDMLGQSLRTESAT